MVDLGEIFWVVVKPDRFTKQGKFRLGEWSRLKENQNQLIGKVLSVNDNHKLSKAHNLKSLFIDLRNELDKRQFGYEQRVSNICEEFLISIVRLITNRENQIIKNQNWFLSFDAMLKSNLSYKWTLEDMTAESNVGITTLTHLVKENTGYTPANYLIYLRLEKAKELLVNSNKKLTDIAYDCGFYSSQHFSSTFSKWVGIAPKDFRIKEKR